MNSPQFKVFFPSLNETFTISPLYDPPEEKMYWIEDDEEKARWYVITGFPTCTMQRGGKGGRQLFCHSSWEVKVGEIVND